MHDYDIKLNLIKYAFTVSVGKFLRFMVTQMGIEVNLAHIQAVLETSTPSNKKEMQHLRGQLVALGRFIACLTNKLCLLFSTLRGANTFG